MYGDEAATVMDAGAYTLGDVRLHGEGGHDTIIGGSGNDFLVGGQGEDAIFGNAGTIVIAVMIMISTFGCNNGLILAGARVYYAMAKDRLFVGGMGRLNRFHVPAAGLWWQGLWACLLVLPRTRTRDATGALALDGAGNPTYGNLYGMLLDYVVFAVLIFYVLTILGLFILRRKRPDAPRPYRAFGYPWVPALYVLAAATILVVLFLYKFATSWPGLVIVLTGVPFYLLWHRGAAASRN
jgi:APA family basic amino acid/polyamine antiporter